jgi:hypothetical protein
MMRALVAALAVVLVCVSVIRAEEMTGKVKKMDAANQQMTLTDQEGKEHTATLDKGATVLGPNGKVQKEGINSKRLKPGTPVKITYEMKDGQMSVNHVAIIRTKKQQ